MTDILLCGALGGMGRVITALVADDANLRQKCRVVAGIDIASAPTDFPLFAAPSQFGGRADVIVDFSHPSALPGVLEYPVTSGQPAVIATTGLTDSHKNLIRRASERVPVFFSANMSLGVTLIAELARTAARVLGGAFDIEIVEKHHNQKIDAPSGTALLLADAVSSVLPEAPDYEYNRHDRHDRRPKNEIGIHSVRGGTIVGEHDVIFAGTDEVITISHSAGSKKVFAAGAVRAALWLTGQPAGLYTMNDLVHSD